MSDQFPDARPTQYALRHRHYIPLSVPIRPDMAVSKGDVLLRGHPESLVEKALEPDAEKRGDVPFLPSMKIGRSRRIRGQDYLAWTDALYEKYGLAKASA